MPILTKKAIRNRVHTRLRRKVTGTTERPRLSINFTGRHITAQIINDEEGKTLVSVHTTEKSLDSAALKPNAKGADHVGKLVAERAKEKQIAKVVFDRGGFRYHGKVKALADAARAAGLEF
ncbi:LSU ribosomal protein L18P [Verrucomicrobium sp. GAS474]|uniref:50S ribosomal protein L18 n=1 Tax=Verrucomicrobium sp. GAS474 TaxID=1882831 RepID=UPI00087B5DC5|nr:50S ribosomal protein L18 [Verrucomicrobium sp. GAS474]SDU25897.1 LSU ribosomal protein L18P [Verrucomicrobium sp. GAS474]